MREDADPEDEVEEAVIEGQRGRVRRQPELPEARAVLLLQPGDGFGVDVASVDRLVGEKGAEGARVPPATAAPVQDPFEVAERLAGDGEDAVEIVADRKAALDEARHVASDDADLHVLGGREGRSVVPENGLELPDGGFEIGDLRSEVPDLGHQLGGRRHGPAGIGLRSGLDGALELFLQEAGNETLEVGHGAAKSLTGGAR